MFDSDDGRYARTEVANVIASSEPAAAQFFRLTAPVSFYFTDPDSFPGPLQDESFDLVASEQNPSAPWRIDYASLRVYRSVGPSVLSTVETIDGAVAYLDATGLGFEGFHSGAGLTPGDAGPNPGFPDSGFDPVLALANLPQQYRERWQPLSSPDDWSLIEVNGQILGIQLAEPAYDDELIAVSYTIIDAVYGDVVRRVGRSSLDGEDARIDDPSDPGRRINYFKLLKPAGPIAPPFDGSMYTDLALAWEYELRNFYDLGGADIPVTFFEFLIISTDETLDPRTRMPAEIDPTQRPFCTVLGLDRQTSNGVSAPDGITDIEDQNLFYLRSGFVRFPHPTPMDLPDDVVNSYTQGAISGLPGWMRAPGLYTGPLTAGQRDRLHHYDFEVRWVE